MTAVLAVSQGMRGGAYARSDCARTLVAVAENEINCPQCYYENPKLVDMVVRAFLDTWGNAGDLGRKISEKDLVPIRQIQSLRNS